MISKRILVPVNFGTQSDAALQYAGYISREINSMITCLHVIEEPGYITDKFISRDIKEQIRREAGKRLSAKVNANINDPKIPFEIIITAGKVHRKISEKATDINADFIIMGRSDSVDLTDKLTGSNTKQVITQANIPVITVSNSGYLKNGQILLPLDLSKTVRSKVAKAIEFASILHSKVSVLTIIRSDGESIEAEYRRRLDEIRNIFNNAGVTCHVNLVKSNQPVPMEILSFAKSSKVGLILIMTQQETHYTDRFVGSAAQEIINRSEIPVLSIRPEVQKETNFHNVFLTKQ